jgi:hypothetical protein
MGIKRKKPRSSDDRGPWKAVHRWEKSFGRDVEYYAVLQSRENPFLFAATRSFVVGGFEQDYRKEHRAVDQTEVNGIVRNPESFFRRMEL